MLVEFTLSGHMDLISKGLAAWLPQVEIQPWNFYQHAIKIYTSKV